MDALGELSVLDGCPKHLRPRRCARFCVDGNVGVMAEVTQITEYFAVHECPVCRQPEFVPLPGAFVTEPWHGDLPGPDLSEADEHDWRL